MSMYLYIEYMTSIRCKMTVISILESLHIGFSSIEFGKVQLNQTTHLNESTRKELALLLKKAGLMLLDEDKGAWIEESKQVIIEMVNNSDMLSSTSMEEYLSEKMACDYKMLSDFFALVAGISIQQYIAIQKIERAKELLLYEMLTLKEISKKIRYKNVEELTAQFKKQTGLTPSFFVAIRKKKKQLSSK
jgi:AraC-like DNA-binding protein